MSGVGLFRLGRPGPSRAPPDTESPKGFSVLRKRHSDARELDEERACFRDRDPVVLLLQETDGVRDGSGGNFRAIAETQDLGVAQEDVGVLIHCVCGRRELHCLVRESLGLAAHTPVRERLRPKSAPGELRPHVIAGRTPFGDLRPAESVPVATLLIDGLTGLRRLGRQVGLLTPCLQSLAALVKKAFRLVVVVGEQLDVSRE